MERTASSGKLRRSWIVGIVAICLGIVATVPAAAGENERNDSGTGETVAIELDNSTHDGTGTLDLSSVSADEEWTADTTMGVQDASGRNGQVYMQISGTGVNVEYVYSRTDTVPSYIPMCTDASLYRNGSVINTSEYICKANVPTYFWTTWNYNADFDHGDELCVGWLNFTGFPCLSILA